MILNKNIILGLSFLILLVGMSACQQDDSSFGFNASDTTVNTGSLDFSNLFVSQNTLLSGGPGIDGIPALLLPSFTEPGNISYLSNSNLVVGVKLGEQVRAYPHVVLDWHEIANDEVNGEQVAVTYCPLTGTASGWDLNVNNELTTFGVSGLLYQSNLVPYDRRTGSLWSQILLKRISGSQAGQAIKTFQVVETTWATWKKMYPNTKVMTLSTGHNREYGVYPYGNFKQSLGIIGQVTGSLDDRLHRKERVLGVIANDKVRAYRFDSFKEDRLVTETIEGSKVIVVGSKTRNYLVSFYAKENTDFNLASDPNDPAIIMKDGEENYYDVFGHVINGPDKGDKLAPTIYFIGYWYTFPAYYNEVTIFEN